MTVHLAVTLFDRQGRPVAPPVMARLEERHRWDMRVLVSDEELTFGPLEGTPHLACVESLTDGEFWSDPLPSKLVAPDPPEHAVFKPGALILMRQRAR